VRAEDRQRVPAEDETSRPPKKPKKPASDAVGDMAIIFGVSATFAWTFYATLHSTGKPGAGVDLHVSALVGLIGTAIGACVGLLINGVRR